MLCAFGCTSGTSRFGDDAPDAVTEDARSDVDGQGPDVVDIGVELGLSDAVYDPSADSPPDTTRNADPSEAGDADPDEVGDADADDTADIDVELDSTFPDVPPDPTASRTFFFGHSLVDHIAPNTQVGSVICDIAAADGRECCADGTYPADFFPNLMDNFSVPPEPQMTHRPSCWSGDFTTAGYDTIVITEGNFFWAYEPAWGFIDPATDLVRQIRDALGSAPRIYLFEHWPEFDPVGGQVGMDRWVTSDHEPFFDWFAEIQDGVNAQLAERGDWIGMIPAGRVVARLLREGEPLEELAFDDLFVDNDPHGTPTAYFLLGLVHYLVLHGSLPPFEYELPAYVHPTVRERWAEVVVTAWDELGRVVDDDAQSRVWR